MIFPRKCCLYFQDIVFTFLIITAVTLCVLFSIKDNIPHSPSLFSCYTNPDHNSFRYYLKILPHCSTAYNTLLCTMYILHSYNFLQCKLIMILVFVRDGHTSNEIKRGCKLIVWSDFLNSNKTIHAICMQWTVLGWKLCFKTPPPNTQCQDASKQKKKNSQILKYESMLIDTSAYIDTYV